MEFHSLFQFNSNDLLASGENLYVRKLFLQNHSWIKKFSIIKFWFLANWIALVVLAFVEFFVDFHRFQFMSIKSPKQSQMVTPLCIVYTQRPYKIEKINLIQTVHNKWRIN